MNEKLKNIARKILKLSDIPEEENFGSIIAILMIISIAITLIRVIQECNKNKISDDTMTSEDICNLYGQEIRSYSLRRGWFTKLRIKKILRRKMSKEQYNKYSLKLVNAILDVGENLKDDEVTTLVEAANV
jgi:hypothetical protein